MAQLLQPPFEELEVLVKQRLRLCVLEVHGMIHAWDNPPAQAIQKEDCPCAYTLSGASVPISTASSVQNDLLYARQFIQRVLIAPFADGADGLTTGSEIQQRGDVLLSRLLLYYHAHPRLHLQNQPPLACVQYLEEVQDSGIQLRPAPGGRQYAAIDVTLTIVLRRSIPKILTTWKD